VLTQLRTIGAFGLRILKRGSAPGRSGGGANAVMYCTVLLVLLLNDDGLLYFCVFVIFNVQYNARYAARRVGACTRTPHMHR